MNIAGVLVNSAIFVSTRVAVILEVAANLFMIGTSTDSLALRTANKPNAVSPRSMVCRIKLHVLEVLIVTVVNQHPSPDFFVANSAVIERSVQIVTLFRIRMLGMVILHKAVTIL